MKYIVDFTFRIIMITLWSLIFLTIIIVGFIIGFIWYLKIQKLLFGWEDFKQSNKEIWECSITNFLYKAFTAVPVEGAPDY